MIGWTVVGKASVLVDGQFGSTGKGVAAAWLVQFADHNIDVATTAAGAQAGHTTRHRGGRSYVTFHLPTTGVEHPRALAYSNAGSIIDVPALEQEICDCGIDPNRVIVHPRAAIITEEHRAAERHPDAPTMKLASTMKGVGAALSDKVWRRSPLIGGTETPKWLRIEALDLNHQLARLGTVVIETPQGTDLGLNHGYSYPSVTSRDCIVSTSLDYAGVHPSFLGPVAMVVRTYPIRVGHVVNEFGEQTGHSGPFYPDSKELDWQRDLPGVEPERTTVTKRIRRIATFSYQQYERALRLNRPNIVILTFCDYLPSGLALGNMVRRMRETELIVGLNKVHRAFGFGPYVEDMTSSLDEAMAWYDRRGVA